MLYLSDNQTIVSENGLVLGIELARNNRFVVVFTSTDVGSVVKEFDAFENARDYITSVCVLLRQSGNVVLMKE